MKLNIYKIFSFLTMGLALPLAAYGQAGTVNQVTVGTTVDDVTYVDSEGRTRISRRAAANEANEAQAALNASGTNAQSAANQGMAIGGGGAAQQNFSGSYVDQLAPDTDGLNQLEYEENNSDTKNDGGNQATGMGSMLSMIGAGLLVTGAAMNAASSPCHCAGMPLIAMAVGTILPNAAGAFSAGGAMYDRADLSDYYGENLENLALDSNLGNSTLDNTDAGNIIFNSDGLNGAGPGSLTSSGGSLGTTIGGGFDEQLANGFKVGGFEADSEALRTGKLGEAFDTLEKLKGIDRDAFAADLLAGGNIAETMAKYGLAGSADEFNSALAPYLAKEDADSTLAKFKDGELDEYGKIGEGYGEGSGKFANGPGGAAGDGSGESSTQVFEDEMKKLLGDANDMSLEELLGLNGDGKKGEESANKDAANSDATKRSLASANLAFSGGIEGPAGVYTEATIFERVRRVYKAEMRDLLPFDYFVRTNLKEKRRN